MSLKRNLMKMILLPVLTALFSSQSLASTYCGTIDAAVGARRGVGDFVMTLNSGREVFIGIQNTYGGATSISLLNLTTLVSRERASARVCVDAQMAYNPDVRVAYFSVIYSAY